jgi:hypothetical protein
MKKTFLILVLFLISSFSFAQEKSGYAGMWKAIVKAGNKPTTPTYVSLNPDFTYIWGIDSSQSDPIKGVSKGTWDITSENEIKFIPDNTTDEICYYSPKGENMYKYDFVEKNGVKSKVRMLEMDLYIQKIKEDK